LYKLISSMKFFYSTLLFLAIFSCSKNNSIKTKLIDFTPENTSLIIKTSNLESLKSSFSNSDFLQKLSNNKTYKDLETTLEALTLLNPEKDILICLSKTNDSIQYSIITKQHKNLIKKDSIKNYKEESLAYNNRTITKSTLNNNTFYSTIIDSTFITSSSKNIIDNSFNTKNKDIELEKIYSTINSNKTVSIITKPNTPFITSFFINDSIQLNTFTSYIGVDVEISQDEIFINGITKATDSTKSLISIFKNTIPQENLTQNITPSNSDGFMSFTFNDFNIFKNNLAKFNKKDSIPNSTTLFDNINEIGVIYEDKPKAVVLNTLDIIATKDALLDEHNIIDTYRQIDIFSFSKTDIFSKTFSPLINFNKATKYCIIDDFFIFADTIETLQNIIANYQNKTTLSERDYFKTIKDQLSDEASLMFVANPSALKTIMHKNGLNDTNLDLKKYNSSALQFIYDNNFAHINGIIKKNKTKAALHSISEELNIKLDANLLSNPQFVTNHITKQCFGKNNYQVLF